MDQSSPLIDRSSSETSSVHSAETTSDRKEPGLIDVLMQRSEEYRLLFRLPPDEVLIQDFNCALQENILLQGHMYLFIHHICFYSNIFGFETKKTIAFHEITCVRKAKTAAIFPNAIEIDAVGRKLFFGSFLSRDEAYRLIVDGWAQHSSDAKALLEHQESKSDCSSQDNAISLLERVSESNKLADNSSSAERCKDANDSEEFRTLPNDRSNNEESQKIPEFQENEGGNDERLLTWQIEDVDAPKIPTHFTMVAEAKFQVCVEDFITLFISDHASDFMENFHKVCGDKDFQCTPWKQHEQFGYARDLSFLHPVKVFIGAKLGRCQEVQKFRVYRNSHLVMETSQHVSDVPLADHFHVEAIWDVENDNDQNSCILRVYFNVAFSKRTIFRGKIEQSTKEELREVYAIWINNAHEVLKRKSAAKLEGVSGKDSSMINQEVGIGSSSKIEGLSEELHPTITLSKVAQVVPDGGSIDQQKPVQENLGYMVSILRESLAMFVSYIRSQSHLPLFLVGAFVAILILMQMSIFVLLTRVPEVHLVTHGNHISGIGGCVSENIQWLEQRVGYLKEEMLMVESRMERMRHEHEMLKVHLKTLERLKPKS